MQARMVANTGKNKKKMKKDVGVKEPNKLLRAASVQLPSVASYFSDHGEENADGFTMSGRVTDDEIRRTAQPWSLYLRCVVRPTQQMMNGVWFNVVVYTAIFTVVVLVGLDTYVDDVDPATGQVLPMKFLQTCDCFLLEVGYWSYVPIVIFYLEWAVQLTFCLEIVVKVLNYKYRPLLFFYEPNWSWNLFDLIVVVLGLAWSDGPVAMLRMMRLARLLKVFKRVVQLQIILKGLVRGLQSCVYVALLLLLIMYFYAIMGITFFRENDRFHFGDLGTAMVTLFRAATLEDWTDLMYTSMYGCEQAPSWPVTEQWPCDKPEGLFAFGMFYWVTYVLLAALVTLSLFIGAITLGMAESMEEVLEEKKLSEALASAEAKRKLQERMSQSGKRDEVLALWRGIGEQKDDSPAQKANCLVHWYVNGPARLCRSVAHKGWFTNGVTVAILFAAGLAGLETDPKYASSPVVGYFNQGISIIFTVEVVVKVGPTYLTSLPY